jgi:hypothetical protein
MSDYQPGQEVEVRAEIYPAIGVPVFGWHKAKVVSANNCTEQIYVEFANGARGVFDAGLIRTRDLARKPE